MYTRTILQNYKEKVVNYKEKLQWRKGHIPWRYLAQRARSWKVGVEAL